MSSGSGALDPTACTHHKARLVDRVHDGSEYRSVYGYVTEELCNVDESAVRVGRQVDDVAGGFKVFGTVAHCQKWWDDTPAFVDLDCGNGVAYPLSRELRARFGAFGGCGGDCLETTLVYDEGDNDWKGDVALSQGTLSLRFYCTYDVGTDTVTFWVEYSGCADTGSVPLTLTCAYPQRWWTAEMFTADPLACCNAGPSAFATLTVYGKIPPVYEGRLVGREGGKDVYAVQECCEEACPPTPGCCPDYAIDGDLLLTVHDVVQTGGSLTCTCAGGTFRLDLTACGTFSFPGCALAVTFCLACDFEQSIADGQNGCEYYRLTAGGIEYTPTSCSCDPLSVTFADIPWSIAGGPGGVACSGTLAVTVTYSP